MRTAFGTVAAAIALTWAGSAQAQSDPTRDYEKVAVQKRKYILANEIKLSIGTLPLDPYEKGIGGSLSYTRHFNQYLAWEVFSGTFTYLYDTGLKEQLVDVFGQDPNEFAGPRMVFTTGVELTPFYGKWAFLNDGVTRHAFLIGGYGGVVFGDREDFASSPTGGPTTLGDIRPALGPGLGYRLYISQNWSARLDWRTLLTIRSEQVEEEGSGVDVTMLINLSLSWNFGADI